MNFLKTVCEGIEKKWIKSGFFLLIAVKDK
jgi:hypothetical protein